MSPSGVTSAVVIGVAGSMRACTPAAALALRGRLPAAFRRPAVAAALGEYTYDKLPFAPPRTHWVGLAGRTGAGALGGAVLGGRSGALAGAATGYAGAHAFQELRRRLVDRGLPAVGVAVAEDALAIALALTAAAPRRRRR